MSHAPRPTHPRGRLLRRALTGLLAVSALGVAAAPASAAGPYSVKWSEPSDLKDHTVYRPAVPAGVKMPVLIWGEGGCIANGLVYNGFLSEIASHGIMVIASGGPFQLGITNVAMMGKSIDWAKAQNTRSGGANFNRLIPEDVAVAGHSCGGLESYQLAASRPEVGAVGIMNSGQLEVNQAQLDALKAPVLIVLGGPDDVAYANGRRDFGALPPALPAFLGSLPRGHYGTYFDKAGGSYAQVLKDWVLYQVKGDGAASRMFVGADCRICGGAGGWTVQKRNIP